MKIVISTDDNRVSEHFGRCPVFTIADIVDGKCLNKEVIPNPGHHPGFLPKYFYEKGVGCIIAGGMGGSAQNLFNGYNINQILGISGEIDSVISSFISGDLTNKGSSCKPGAGKGYGLDKSECDHEDHKHGEE